LGRQGGGRYVRATQYTLGGSAQYSDAVDVARGLNGQIFFTNHASCESSHLVEECCSCVGLGDKADSAILIAEPSVLLQSDDAWPSLNGGKLSLIASQMPGKKTKVQKVQPSWCD
jgi:hypothetical protein